MADFPTYCAPDRPCPDCRRIPGTSSDNLAIYGEVAAHDPVPPVVSSGYRGALCAWCGGPRSAGSTLCSRCEPYKRHLDVLMEHDRYR